MYRHMIRISTYKKIAIPVITFIFIYVMNYLILFKRTTQNFFSFHSMNKKFIIIAITSIIIISSIYINSAIWSLKKYIGITMTFPSCIMSYAISFSHIYFIAFIYGAIRNCISPRSCFVKRVTIFFKSGFMKITKTITMNIFSAIRYFANISHRTVFYNYVSELSRR